MRSLLGFSRVRRESEVPSSPAMCGRSLEELTEPPTTPRGEPSSPHAGHGMAQPLQIGEQFLRQAAARWPVRSGARQLQHTSYQLGGREYYESLLTDPITEEDEEQLNLDVERSTVDGLEELYPSGWDEASLSEALHRLLRAWCCRHPGGYCQGLNFVAKVLLVVMLHGARKEEGADGEADGADRAAEEEAFWTFAAINELILPRDFYTAPSMPGLQRDVRVLYQLFLLQLRDSGAGGAPSYLGGRRSMSSTSAPSASLQSSADSSHELSGAAPVPEDKWRDIVKLSAYKWLVPCYVNQLPLPTLLLFWDRLFVRVPPDMTAGGAAAASASFFSSGGLTPASPRTRAGLSAAHLSLALALLCGAADEVIEAIGSAVSIEEGLGVGFNVVLERANDAEVDAGALIHAAATRFAISPQQLQFLRARMAVEPADHHAAEPQLSGLQATTLMLMRRSEYLPVRMLKHAMLLAPPLASPLSSVSNVTFYYPRLCSACSLTFAAFCVWLGSAAVGRSGRVAF